MPDLPAPGSLIRACAWGLLVLGLFVGLGHWFGSGEAARDEAAAVAGRIGPSGRSAETDWDLGEIGGGTGGIDRSRPPSLESLDSAASQRVYDAGAEPGDFVTPPAVSVPH